ncbi:MAG TPA: anti-phage protein KwaB [Methylophilaceae bacterium]|nr:anti-phage protein KwaB [Methylophilaceae bacterium]
MKELLKRINNVINAKNVTAEIYFLMKTAKGVEIKSADLDETSQASLTNQFKNSIENTLVKNQELALFKITEADDRNNVVYEYDLAKIPDKLKSLSAVLNNNNFDVFNFETDDLSTIDGIIVVLGNHTSQIALYKHQYPIYLMNRHKEFSLRRKGALNRFEKVEEDILKITPSFDFFQIEKELFVLDLKLLERSFGFEEAIQNGAKAAIQVIQQANLVHNMNMLVGRLNELPFARKLLRASKNSPVLGIVPFNHILAFTNQHPALKGRFHLNPTGTMFDLNTKISQNLFLKLLNDDLLQSELTQKYYDSIAKDSVV